MATTTTITREERDARRKRIFELKAQGYSYSEIAKLTGVNTATVGHYLTYQPKRSDLVMTVDQLRAKYTRLPKSKGAVNGHSHEDAGQATAAEESIANHVSYALGRTEAWCEVYADGAGISRLALTRQLGELLQRKARR